MNGKHLFFKKYFLLFCGFACAVLCSCENDLNEINRIFSEEDIGVEIAKDVEILYSDSAVVRVRMKGPTMKRYTELDESREEFPDGITVDFFEKNGSTTSWLSARKGVRYESKGQMIVQDSVVWESANKDRLETEELIWDEKTEKVYTNKFVVVRRPDEILYGYGFESNQNFTHSKIRAIEGRLKVETRDKVPEE